MRGMFGLVSLLIVTVGGVMYFTETQPEVADKEVSQNVQNQANKAAALMANRGDDAQAQVDAASGDKPAAPATNAPPAP